MAKPYLKTAYLIALVVLGISFVFYFMNSAEGFYANNHILTSTTQSGAQQCFEYCNGDVSSGTYSNYEWCGDGFMNTSGATTKRTCTSNNACKCINKRA